MGGGEGAGCVSKPCLLQSGLLIQTTAGIRIMAIFVSQNRRSEDHTVGDYGFKIFSHRLADWIFHVVIFVWIVNLAVL
jgi:hypothetical protein